MTDRGLGASAHAEESRVRGGSVLERRGIAIATILSVAFGLLAAAIFAIFPGDIQFASFLFLGQPRYHAPLLPLFSLLAALALARCLGRFSITRAFER